MFKTSEALFCDRFNSCSSLIISSDRSNYLDAIAFFKYSLSAIMEEVENPFIPKTNHPFKSHIHIKFP
ncbi:hypothetical protein BTM29_05090 [Companilactobacillus allii]|uniref:Uncharacterized protein n=1 Tax=Companilactobacillus allii TaxID=1847728 RepID=A0A1P8Q2F0_9LACO|nr:hypothetical protein BTM29_05090 [Companilactobacillus allii]